MCMFAKTVGNVIIGSCVGCSAENQVVVEIPRYTDIPVACIVPIAVDPASPVYNRLLRFVLCRR